MSRADELKEKIGWYKVVFVTLMVTALSLIGWVANHLGDPHKAMLNAMAIIATLILAVGLWGINRAAFKAMDELEEEP